MTKVTIVHLKKKFPDASIYFYSKDFKGNSIKRLREKGLKSFHTPFGIQNTKFKIPDKLIFLSLIFELALFRVAGIGIFWKQFYKEFCKFDLLVDISGDSYSTDYRGGLKYSIFPVAVAKALRIKYCFIAQSIGPFDSSFLFRIFTYILRGAFLVTVREDISYKLLESMGLRENLFVTSDLSFLLEPASSDTVNKFKSTYHIGENKLVFFNFSSLSLKYLKNRVSEKTFAERLEPALRSIIDSGYWIVLLPHVTIPGISDDRDVLKVVYNRFDREDKIIFISEEYDGETLKGLIAKSTYFIGSRMHATLGALSQCIPTITLAYSHKTLGINGARLGQREYIIDLREYTLDEFVDQLRIKFETLFKNAKYIKKRLKKTIDDEKALATVNFDLIKEKY